MDTTPFCAGTQTLGLTSGVLMINEVVCCLAVVCLVSRKGNFPPRIWLAYITNNEGA